ncbi:MAG TPA: arsenosugar biosynthesis radical SAM (seleno)protein ArsS [Acidobacteriota bacterium]
MASPTKTLPILGQFDTADFDAVLAQRGVGPLSRVETTTLQINVGKLCNQACHHCHVEAGPKRTEIMPVEVAQRAIALLDNSPTIDTVDITGGAPELNPHFRWLVREARRRGLQVIDRCNLTVLFERGQAGLAEFLAEYQVTITASLPCYTAENVDKQRGKGVFDKSICALEVLNELGYGKGDSNLTLNLVYNPLGAYLPPPQEKLEGDYKRQLREHYGIEFDHLFTITNMPIKRFAEFLMRSGKHEQYMSLLVNHFNPATVEKLMCRSLVSVGWDGKLYDCDFNQMLEIKMPGVSTIWEIDSFSGMAGRLIATASHCFGCTAGSGSGCGGSLQ